MSDSGAIRVWTDEGWGVIDSPTTLGGCWAHFSMLAADSFWEPSAGEPVEFEFETADQDGFMFRATRVWPSGSKPIEHQPNTPGPGYTSELNIEFD